MLETKTCVSIYIIKTYLIKLICTKYFFIKKLISSGVGWTYEAMLLESSLNGHLSVTVVGAPSYNTNKNIYSLIPLYKTRVIFQVTKYKLFNIVK